MSKREEPKDQPDRYEWWEQEKAMFMLASLANALEQAGEKGRLCRHEKPNADGQAVSWFSVRDSEGTQVGQAFDDSWLCPPLCG